MFGDFWRCFSVLLKVLLVSIDFFCGLIYGFVVGFVAGFSTQKVFFLINGVFGRDCLVFIRGFLEF